MRIESILPVLVPLTFVALWAITSMFNREAQPLPPRTGTPPVPGPSSESDGRVARPIPRRSPSVPGPGPRGAMPNGVPRQKPGPPPRDSDIVILDWKSPTALKEAEANMRRSLKARKKSPAKSDRKEGSTSSGMSRSLGTTIVETVGPGLNLVPLELPPSPLLQPGSGPLSSASLASVSPSRPSSTREVDLKALLRSRTRLQEAWIISEVLQPPLALRKRGIQRP